MKDAGRLHLLSNLLGKPVSALSTRTAPWRMCRDFHFIPTGDRMLHGSIFRRFSHAHRYSFCTPLFVLPFVFASMQVASALAQSPAPDPSQGDGRVSAFYRWTGPVPGKPGQLLNTEPLPNELGLSQAGIQKRILYTSTDGVDDTSPTIVSGAVFIPKGTPPAGGWPVVAWAHGTVGMADICAPSWAGRSYRDIVYLNRWLSEGFAIDATDYQGLGTLGPHPYLKTRPAAYSVLDSIRAVLGGDFGVSNNVILVGQSQGGGAAFATAAFAPHYAPELNIRGTVATGVPYLSEKTLSKPPSKDPHKVDPTLAYVLYID